uniref:metallophosphoesterase n=1 Tax=Acetatifactor sp. TaxID=1872090 RepID=UPI004055AA58
MRYIISDIHGCYAEYKELLKKISFSDADELYVLGDAVDRGPEPIKVLQDMMKRSNVIYIIGNHDYMMLAALKKLAVEITEENCENHLTEEDLLNYSFWLQDGGETTARQFAALSRWDQQDILDYLAEASVYEIFEEKDKRFILVHAGINEFDEAKDLDEYDFTDFIYYRADYSKRYFGDESTYLVTGHTPTPFIREDKKSIVYQENGHIGIDCGCVFGGQLAAYCAETGDITYVEKFT